MLVIYLEDQSLSKKLITVNIAENYSLRTREKLNSPSNLILLYHSFDNVISDIIRESSNDISKKLDDALTLLLNHIDIIKESEFVVYQKELLRRLEYINTSNKNTILKIANELKENLIALLDSSSSNLRKRSIIVLSNNVDLLLSEQELLFKMLDDNDYYVREEAIKYVNSVLIETNHENIIKELMGSTSSSTRKIAANLMGKLSNSSATSHLASKLNDSDYYVREEVYTQLSNRTLTTQDLPALSTLLTDSSSSVRKRGVILISSIENIEATKLIISALNDNDYYVREESFNHLDSRTLSQEVITLFAQLLNDSSSSVRKISAYFLGKIKHPNAKDALTQRLAIETDYYVKEQLNSSIDAQN